MMMICKGKLCTAHKRKKKRRKKKKTEEEEMKLMMTTMMIKGDILYSMYCHHMPTRMHTDQPMRSLSCFIVCAICPMKVTFPLDLMSMSKLLLGFGAEEEV